LKGCVVTHNPNFVIERPTPEAARQPLPLVLKLSLLFCALILVASRLVAWIQ